MYLSMPPSSTSPFDEIQWVVRIRRTLVEEVELGDEEQPVSIADVPKPLLITKPEAYTPQVIALGPYHYLREELHDMERYKLFAARITQSQLPDNTFQRLVNLFIELEHQIRAHYHRYLKFNGETLAWMMAIDASFLLEFLHTFAIDGGQTRGVSSRMSHLVDSKRRTLPHSLLLRDIMMLENQIPLFLLRSILEIQSPSSQDADDRLTSMLIGYFKEVSPFKLSEGSPCVDLDRCSHLLDFLYHLLVPNLEEEESLETTEKCDQAQPHLTKCLGKRILVFLFSRARALLLVVIKFLVRIPLKIMLSLPVLSTIRPLVEHLFHCKVDPHSKAGGGEISANCHLTSPLRDEIAIPSVAELAKAGIRFSPRNGNISTIEFSIKDGTIYLPAVSLDVHTDVVLRNLVAYEASLGSRPLAFSRYIELMNGIVDTAEDARLLSEAGVVQNHLKTDEEVAELWNGMTRSVRLTRVSSLDKVIEEVNSYYNGRWKTKVGRFVKRYAVISWHFLIVLTLLLILLVMSSQVFCVVYGCASRSHVQRQKP